MFFLKPVSLITNDLKKNWTPTPFRASLIAFKLLAATLIMCLTNQVNGESRPETPQHVYHPSQVNVSTNNQISEDTRLFFEKMWVTIIKQDAHSLATMFDFNLTVEKCYTSGYLPEIYSKKENQTHLARYLENNISEQFIHQSAGVKWPWCRLKHEKTDAANKFRIITGQFYDYTDTPTTIQFHLVKHENNWKIYNFFDFNIGMSYIQGIGFGIQAGNSHDAQTKNAIKNFLQLSKKAKYDIVKSDIDKINPNHMPKPARHTVYTYIAAFALDDEDWEKAIELANKSISLNKQSVFAYHIKAIAANAQGQHEVALAMCDTYTEISGSSEIVLPERIKALTMLNRENEVPRALDQILKNNPRHAFMATQWLERCTATQLNELVSNYADLETPRQWVDLIGDQLVASNQIDLLPTLIKAHQETAPKDIDGILYLQLLQRDANNIESNPKAVVPTQHYQ